jgi:hypothetical protein
MYRWRFLRSLLREGSDRNGRSCTLAWPLSIRRVAIVRWSKCKATQSGGPRKKRKAAADVAPVAGEGAAAAQAEGGEGEGDGEKEGGEAEAEVEQLEDVDRDVTLPPSPNPGVKGPR